MIVRVQPAIMILEPRIVQLQMALVCRLYTYDRTIDKGQRRFKCTKNLLDVRDPLDLCANAKRRHGDKRSDDGLNNRPNLRPHLSPSTSWRSTTPRRRTEAQPQVPHQRR